jgi:hypothetical protein
MEQFGMTLPLSNFRYNTLSDLQVFFWKSPLVMEEVKLLCRVLREFSSKKLIVHLEPWLLHHSEQHIETGKVRTLRVKLESDRPVKMYLQEGSFKMPGLQNLDVASIHTVAPDPTDGYWLPSLCPPELPIFLDIGRDESDTWWLFSWTSEDKYESVWVLVNYRDRKMYSGYGSHRHRWDNLGNLTGEHVQWAESRY